MKYERSYDPYKYHIKNLNRLFLGSLKQPHPGNHGDDKNQRPPQHHPAPAMAIRNDPPQQHSGRHAEQVDGEGGVDLRLARLQGIGNLGHGHQIEIDPDRVEDDHQESAQQDARELLDGNAWEGTIAHELFHQWFGDYVTTESWGNLTLNESFANYSEYLWDEYKYGKDKADATHYSAMQGYLGSGSEQKDLVRFYYADKEDMFDAVSYNKGGRILHMLRNYVGDSAFFKSLNLYLTTHKYKTAEAHQLRLAFEEVTGKDLNWFFNQWYFGAGHPTLDINYSYDEATKQVNVIVKQTQKDKLFQLPVAIDIYNGSKKTREQVWVKNAVDTFSFSVSAKPDLVNFDGDKVLLAVKKENKTLDEYIHQYKHAGLYLDRREAIDFISKKQDDAKAVAFLKEAINDKYSGLRNFALGKLDVKKATIVDATETAIATMAQKDASEMLATIRTCTHRLIAFLLHQRPA